MGLPLFNLPVFGPVRINWGGANPPQTNESQQHVQEPPIESEGRHPTTEQGIPREAGQQSMASQQTSIEKSDEKKGDPRTENEKPQEQHIEVHPSVDLVIADLNVRSQVQQSEAVKTSLSSSVSSEERTPLTSIVEQQSKENESQQHVQELPIESGGRHPTTEQGISGEAGQQSMASQQTSIEKSDEKKGDPRTESEKPQEQNGEVHPSVEGQQSEAVKTSFFHEIPAIQEILQSKIQNDESFSPELSGKFKVLSSSIAPAIEEDAATQIQDMCKTLLDVIIPSLAEQEQIIFRNQLETLHQEVSSILGGENWPAACRTASSTLLSDLRDISDRANNRAVRETEKEEKRSLSTELAGKNEPIVISLPGGWKRHRHNKNH